MEPGLLRFNVEVYGYIGHLIPLYCCTTTVLLNTTTTTVLFLLTTTTTVTGSTIMGVGPGYGSETRKIAFLFILSFTKTACFYIYTIFY